ncbi:Cellular retinaldehyde binding/alpha-tocopherol transport [Macleaya cordata]|uniref:Cellular retinaldehyde binding/alpha-tocopherol transport n=1 Tax=Macleaya cordata TaxID=56857 RepID=A0A200PW02_MACCD|nr:Cellular retinaldehyde binding/alpha-tocopherol transport [Macleaya cordata]
MEGNDFTGEEILTRNDENHQQNHDPHVVEEETINAPKELKPSAKKALLEFRCRLEKAILTNDLFDNLEPEKNNSNSESDSIEDLSLREDIRDISLWGVPLLPSKGHEGTDIILLKFLRARDFKVSEALEMLRKTLKWRKEFDTEGILEEDFGSDLENVAYLDGSDKEGHPLCYIVYGAFRDKDLYQNMFECENKWDKFIRWRIQSMERAIRNLSFKDGGMNSMVHITDLKSSPGPAMKDLRTASKKAISLLQDKYPEIVVRNIVINVPFWYYAYHALSSRMLTQRMRNKFVFARPSRVAKTLLKFIAPENIPVQYGGLKRENDDEFSPDDEVSEVTVKGGAVETIRITVNEPGVTVVWDITVIGWDVTYKEEFIPDDEGSYKIVIQAEKKMLASVRSSYYINEPGKVELTITNNTYKKKKILHRFKIKPTVPMYVFLN